MIRESFVFLDRIGLKTENNIWKQGIEDWEMFISAKKIRGIGLRKGFFDRQIRNMRKELYNSSMGFLKRAIPASEAWRLYEMFRDEAVFLDIETAHYYGHITVIGLYDGYDTKMMIKDINLDKQALKKELEKYKLIITFNGSSFDLPVIERYFQGVVPDVPHIDLRHVCSRIGLKGGLKQIENDLGIKRLPELKNVTGEDAANLWRVFKATGDDYYLDLLIKYNEEDIINLKPIADFAARGLWKRIRGNS
ncbi:hypothetical protein GF345_02940 [Candidatus Woesearchaeota archaeon]|nr:hypothetical protein [Candidatus Woesearchaeota archaeon]